MKPGDLSNFAKGVGLVLSLALPLAVNVLLSSAVYAAPPDFERQVAPILINHCLECHNSQKHEGSLDLSTPEGLLRGGEGGAIIVSGESAKSRLIERVRAGEMPPQSEELPEGKLQNRPQPLTPRQIEILAQWIDAGAPWPKARRLAPFEQSIDLENGRRHWSFRPLRRPAIPSLIGSPNEQNPIDVFIARRRRALGMTTPPRASRRQFLRRAHLDLIGLPPTLSEQEEFLADQAPGAQERLIDRLLARPGYGERWARYWLDLVRFADSNGYERDAEKPSVWRYRDYVIDSLNRDKPFDRFALEQLAGDELPGAGAETLTAMGFYALGTWQDEVDPLEQPQYRADELDDLVRTTSSVFLGITLGCARCHNHKFDPFTMTDYYSFAAILDPLRRPNVGRTDRDLPLGDRRQVSEQKKRDARIQQLEKEIKSLQSNNKTKQSQQAKEKIAKHENEIRSLKAMGSLPRGYYLYEPSPHPGPTYLLQRGRASSPGPPMKPRVPAVLAEAQPAFSPPDAHTSRRRISMAQWIVDSDNPLTARVIVNRLWQRHFGRGLSTTPSDFGNLGGAPTHPQLLDWLAHWFVHDARWSLKRLHRLIMTSQTYQMTGEPPHKYHQQDPENTLLWAFPLRRLDAETIRDCTLAVSGQLQRKMHGPAVKLPLPPEVVEAHTDKQKAWQTSPPPDIYRRTVYAFTKRTLLNPMLEVLDLCDTTQSVAKRNVTTIAPQALTLFNGRLVNEQAEKFAKRLQQEAGDNASDQIDLAYRLALARRPTKTEQAALQQFLQQEVRQLKEANPQQAKRKALVQMCRVIFNLNEFVYMH